MQFEGQIGFLRANKGQPGTLLLALLRAGRAAAREQLRGAWVLTCAGAGWLRDLWDAAEASAKVSRQGAKNSRLSARITRPGRENIAVECENIAPRREDIAVERGKLAVERGKLAVERVNIAQNYPLSSSSDPLERQEKDSQEQEPIPPANSSHGSARISRVSTTIANLGGPGVASTGVTGIAGAWRGRNRRSGHELAALATLRAAGLRERKASALARLHQVTPALVRRHLQQARAQAHGLCTAIRRIEHHSDLPPSRQPATGPPIHRTAALIGAQWGQTTDRAGFASFDSWAAAPMPRAKVRAARRSRVPRGGTV